MKLRNRIIIAAAIPIVITALLIGLMSVQQIKNSTNLEDQRWSKAMANAVAKAVTRDTLSRDRVAVRNVLNRVMASNDELAYLVVVDFHEEIFALTTSNDATGLISEITKLDRKVESHQFQFNGIRVKDLGYPLIEGLDARLHIGIKLSHISEITRQVVIRIFLGSFAIMIAAILAASYIGYRISNPITQLATAIQAYGRGEVSDKFYTFQPAGYEIRRLYESFRTMLTERDRNTKIMQAQSMQYLAVIETSGDGFWMLDREGFLQEFNDSYARLSGYSHEELLGIHISELDAMESDQEARAHINRIMHKGNELFETQHRNRAGMLWDVEVSISYHDLYGGVLFAFIRDITDRKKDLQQKRITAEVFNNTSEGIVITDANNLIIDVNRAYCEIMGYRRDEVIGKAPAMVKSGRHDKAFYDAMWHSINENGKWVGEVWDRRKNGETFPKWLNINAVSNDAGEVSHYVGTFSDITALKDTENQLQHMAYYDALTGLPNRSLFMDRLTQEIATSRRLHHKCAVLFIDLDRFKNVNDTLGHTAGDELLAVIADRISNRVRDNDTVARLGGDEFTVVLRDIVDVDAVALISTKIINSLMDPVTLMGNEVRVGGSIGIAVFPDDGEDPESLIKHADAAMYVAKSAGRGQYHFYTEQIDKRAHENLRIESELHHAIEKEQFFMEYQPQIDAQTGRVVGGEALIRWQHPSLGLVAPDKFIGIAEESGVILQIGEWIMNQVCEDIREWLYRGLTVPPIAINLSARQFRHTNLFESVSMVVDRCKLPTNLIELEITENVAMDNTTITAERLQLLSDSGYSIAIDDFGTGYSSLNYLKRFPVNKLKLDRSFVDEIPHDTNDMAISSAVIRMAHSLGLKVVAEGVETEEQRQFLITEGCDIMQGYLFSKPISGDEFANYISA